MGVESVDRFLEHLRPEFARKVELLLGDCERRGLPFGLFEGFRSHARQGWLYASGRTRPGRVVTHAAAWQSYHEFGAAADLVLWVNGAWCWNTGALAGGKWVHMHELARARGLRVLDWDLPHVQLAGVSLQDLAAEAKAGGIGHGAD